MNQKFKELIKNIGVFALSNMAIKVVTFLVLPLYTYYLTQEEYAIIDLVNSTTQLIMPVFTLCMADAVLRFGISKLEKKEDVFTSAFVVVIAGSAILPVFMLIFQSFIDIGDYLYVFYIIYVLMVFNNVLSAFCKAIDKVKEMAIISMFTSISIVVLNVLFVAVLQLGISGYFTATIIGYLCGALAYWFVCKIYKYFKIKSFNKDLLKEMALYALPLIPNALCWWVNSNLDKYVLTAMTSLSIVGLYSVANKIPTIVSTVTSIFSQAWNISTFQTYEEEGANDYYNNIAEIFNVIMFVVTSGIIILSQIIAKILFSKGFVEAWVLIPVLTLGAFYNAKNSFLGSFFTASKQTKYIFYTTGAGAAINAVLNVLFVYLWGMQGAAIATCVSYIVVFVVRRNKIADIMGFRTHLRTELICFGFLVAESILVLLNRLDCFIVAIIALIIVYIYIFIKYIKNGEIKRLIK